MVLIGDVRTLHASTGMLANLRKRCIPASAKYYTFIDAEDVTDLKMAREIMVTLALSEQGTCVFAERILDNFYDEIEPKNKLIALYV